MAGDTSGPTGLLSPRVLGLHGDSRRERIAKRQARSAYVQHHAVACVDDADAGAFADA
jgi:hypothetical protein